MAVKTKCWQDSRVWHKWFAWHRVTLRSWRENGRSCRKTAFWVYVERKYDTFWDDWEYREIEDG